MKSLGHPLLGDTLYGGGNTKFERTLGELLQGQCLCATHIGFTHPTSGEFLRLDCGLPDYFEAILDKMRRMTS